MNSIFMILYIQVKNHQMKVIHHEIKIKNRKINKSYIPHIQAQNQFQILLLLYLHQILVKRILNYKLINLFNIIVRNKSFKILKDHNKIIKKN